MEAILLRAAERLLGVLIGGLTIYLGYNLFLKLPEQTDSMGKIILPGGISVFLSRVGPGVFFSLFGTIVVGVSLYYQLKIDVAKPATTQDRAAVTDTQVISYRGFGTADQALSADDLEAIRVQARGVLFELNRLPKFLSSQTPRDVAVSARLALRESKLAVLTTIWGKDWGEYAQFKDWISNGEPAPIPENFKGAVQLYHHGEGAEFQ